MLVIKEMKLLSDEVIHWVQADSNVSKLLTQLIHRIGLQMRRAKKREVYAFRHLQILYGYLEACQHALTQMYEQCRSNLLQKDPNIFERIKPIAPLQTEYRTGTPLIYALLQCLQQLDAILYLLSLSRIVGVFKFQQQHHLAQYRAKSVFYLTLSQILKDTGLKSSHVTLTDYLENNAAYQSACEQYGAIDPEDLFAAIQSYYVPKIPFEELEKIVTTLQEKYKRLKSLNTESSQLSTFTTEGNHDVITT